jgi:hypothetical protein
MRNAGRLDGEDPAGHLGHRLLVVGPAVDGTAVEAGYRTFDDVAGRPSTVSAPCPPADTRDLRPEPRVACE